MARIAGIQIEKDAKGKPAYARINLKKHKEALTFLEQLGAIDEDEFDKEWKRGLTIEQCKEKMHNRIAKWFESENDLSDCISCKELKKNVITHIRTKYGKNSQYFKKT